MPNIPFGYYPAHAVSERDDVFRRTDRIHRSWRLALIPAPHSMNPHAAKPAEVSYHIPVRKQSFFSLAFPQQTDFQPRYAVFSH
jgi:hypothetical protein